jgi:hypothetical protein
MTKHLSLLSAVAIVGVLASGCARAQARTTPDGPPLEVPAPPPRDVEPAAIEPLATTAPPPVTPPAAPPEPARNPPPRPRAAPAPPRDTRENKPPEPPRTEPVAPESEARPPAGTLQTKPAGEEVDVERSIRVALRNANTDLSRVDYRKLDADARSQYDYAKRFVSQAEEALRAKNLGFAKTVADKAAALAAQLAGR